MMFNNGYVNRFKGERSHALGNFTGTNSPAAPLSGKQRLGARKADPSSAARGDKYPIPSFFDFRSAQGSQAAE